MSTIPGYRCEVMASPFALRVYHADRLVLHTGVGAGSFCRDGHWRQVTEIIEEQRAGESVSYRCATTTPDFTVTLALVFHPDGIDVTWAPEDGQACELIDDVYDLASAGHWYGHGYHEPQYWPLDAGEVKNDPFLCNNVQSPIWLTSGGAGIVIPTEELLCVSLNAGGDGLFRVGMKGVAEFSYRILIGENLPDLFSRLLGVVGKPSRIPPRDLFERPIYSTWTEHPRYLTQAKVVDFARRIVEAGLPAGILEVDEKYQPSFGEISFDPETFPDPAGMLAELHALGFQTTLWSSPFINVDSPAFTELATLGGLVKDRERGEPALLTWWGGQAGLLDVTSPAGDRWYAEHLQAMKDLGFIGFKFDGGDGKYTPPFADSAYYMPQRPQGYSNRYLEFIARHFPDYAESRTAWMTQREGLVAREGGKDTCWGLDNGLHALITQGMTQGLLGYPYLICDMIPGRVRTRFADAPLPTDELFVRWVEASAFTPIMQFSYGPWHYDAVTCDVSCRYARLHEALGDYLYAVAEEAHLAGTPMVRPLFFHDPADAATYTVNDAFLLGGDLLVAPVIREGATARDIYLPAGEWTDAWTGQVYEGRRQLRDHPAPCPGIPLFVRQEGAWSDVLVDVLSEHLVAIPRGAVPSGVTTTTYSAVLQRTI